MSSLNFDGFAMPLESDPKNERKSFDSFNLNANKTTLFKMSRVDTGAGVTPAHRNIYKYSVTDSNNKIVYYVESDKNIVDLLNRFIGTTPYKVTTLREIEGKNWNKESGWFPAPHIQICEYVGKMPYNYEIADDYESATITFPTAKEVYSRFLSKKYENVVYKGCATECKILTTNSVSVDD